MAPPPNVTGLSPNEGLPGTRIKIRGEYLGISPTDLIGLTICGCDCLLSAEWKSQNMIIAISGIGKGKGDVIVTTKSGGIGTCSVTFKGGAQGKIGLTTNSAVWVEESTVNYWGPHSLSPGSFEQEDPLGLSVEGNDRKFPENLQELFPESSGDITSENFSPIWFLLENHHATTFNDLQAGLLHLRRKVEGQKEGQLLFLKANVAPVMDQIDTINILREKFVADIKEYNSEPTTLKLQKAIKESERQARKLFDDVLARRDRAEKTRNALNVLARFRFLFCLPCVMERNIKKGDYDIVINDYMRVKNLFNKTDVPVFKAALGEIEKRVVSLQKMLHEKLTKMPISVEEQKRLIRYLVHLESPYEPAWDAIKSHSDYILLQIKECYDDHKAAEAALAEELAKLKNSSSASKYNKYNANMQDLNAVPEIILYMEDLCQIITDLFPDLWKIGQSYFTGELHVKVEAGRQVGFKHIVLTITETYCKSLRSAIIPHTLVKNTDKSTYGSWVIPETDVIALYLPDCLRYVRSTYSILIKLDLPSEPLDIIFGLILDLRIHCMSILFKQSIEQVKQLAKQETWKIEFTSTHSGITKLPIQFEQLVQKVIQVVRESVLTSEQREGAFLGNSTAHKELDKQVEALLMAFYEVLNSLASKEDFEDDDDHSPVVSQLIGTPSNAYNRSHSNRHIPVWEHRLLTTLSNCQYTKTKVFNGFMELFIKSGYPTPKIPIDNVRNKLEALEKSILEAYLEQKSDPLVGTIEPSMYLGRFDWDTNVIPKDIRPYAKECFDNLIHIQSEVNSISPMLVDHVLPHIVQTIAEELYRLMSCVQMFSVAGNQQARADVGALQEVLKNYATPNAMGYFKEALEVIPPLQKSDLLLVDDIMKQVRVRMRLQILCLACNGPREE